MDKHILKEVDNILYNADTQEYVDVIEEAETSFFDEAPYGRSSKGRRQDMKYWRRGSEKGYDTLSMRQARLSRREWQVVEAMDCGCSAEEIAEYLGLTVNTVYSYKKSAMRKLQPFIEEPTPCTYSKEHNKEIKRKYKEMTK